jgi:chromate transporter
MRLRDLARSFTWLGLTAFGGPAAHIAIMQREFVERRAWVTHARFVDLLGLASLLPGPTSTEMTMGIGFEQRRWAGLLVAGLGFILPASLIVLVVAMLYQGAGSLDGARSLLYGMSPVVIAVIGHAMIRLVPTALTDVPTWTVGVAAFAGSVVGFALSLWFLQPVAILLGGAVVLLVVRRLPDLPLGRSSSTAALVFTSPSGAMLAAAVSASLGVGAIFLTFLKMGLVVFGSGYVLVAFLGSELVAPGYLTEQQLLDAIAIGQLTPGPVFTSATFIGYLLAGVPGAVAATVGIFLPSFLLVGATHPFLPRIRASRTLSTAIDGLNAAAVGLIAASIVFLGRDALFPSGSLDLLAVVLALGSFVILLSGRLGPVPLLLAGAAIGFVAQTPLR